MKNKISFCITFYNQEKFVEDSINSILSMDLPFNYEILVGDDGSQDNTVKNVKKLIKIYPDIIKLFVMPRDKNIQYNFIERASKNRLNLVKESTGEYIAFLDGDDSFCDNTYVKEAIDILDKNSSLVACTGNYKNVYEDGDQDSIKQLLSIGIVKPKDYITTTYVPAGCSIFRNIWCKKKEYDKKLEKCFDDNVIMLYLLQYGDMYYTNKVVYAYRQLKDSIWHDATATEQHILNALDYNILCSLVPKFKTSILKRQFSALKYLYKHKRKIKKLIDRTKYDKLSEQTKHDFFVNSCICYPDISFKQKIKLFLYYYKLKKEFKRTR